MLRRKLILPIVLGALVGATAAGLVLKRRERECVQGAEEGEVAGFPWSLYMKMLRTTVKTGREVVCVIYENNDVECFLLGPYGGCFPIRGPVREIVHTHPLPRWTPSIVDIAEAYRISKTVGRPVPFKVITYVPEREEVVVYEVKIDPKALPEEFEIVLKEIEPFDELMLCLDPDEVSKMQHEVMKVVPYITVTRYVRKMRLENFLEQHHK